MKLDDELATFLDEERLSDVTIQTQDGVVIRAHKIILAARSRYLAVKDFLNIYS
mgnify:FL=1